MYKFILAATFAAQVAQAQTVHECDWLGSARSIVEPWEENTRTFANGKTRIAVLDTDGEPAGGSYYLLVLSPPYGELGGRQCRVIGYRSIGFGYIDFLAIKTSYDPAKGLTFILPVEVYDGSNFVPATLSATLNQATGHIATDVWR